MVNADALHVLLPAAVGLVVSVGVERLMTPRPRPLHQRAWASVALHGGVWLAISAVLVLLLGRPWFALAAETALLLLIVVVNNAKVASLREPFVFQDHEYFTDAIRHPRLYIPFLGWGKAAVAAMGFALAVCVGLWLESIPVNRWAWSGQLGGLTLVVACAVLLLVTGNLGKLVPTFDPIRDLRKLGLLASLWCYARAERIRPALSSPFASAPEPAQGLIRPHLVAVQSESFFDPRRIFSGIQENMLVEFDALKMSALAHGRLTVPAWGANTVRSEFAFLSGVGTSALKVHRFNPYRKVVRWGIPTLASYLKQLGYRTICVHPYPAGFYGRNKIYPLMGFDEFIDIREFMDADRSGAYVGDISVARKIADIIENATEPVFVHAITMENHGPLHLEKITDADVESLYSRAPPPGCDDLTAYLKHLRNADSMLAMLRDTIKGLQKPASLCWFGDHVPIMESTYRALGLPDGKTEFLLWGTAHTAAPEIHNLEVNKLAEIWLRHMGLMPMIDFLSDY